MSSDDDLTAYLNGRFAPLKELSVRVSDRGLLLGDGAFETIRVIRGRPYLLASHLERLSQTLHALSIPMETAHLPSICDEMIGRAAVEEAMLRITVTRGAGGEGYLPPPSPVPTLLITCRPLDVTALPKAPAQLLLSRRPKIPPACLPTQGKTLQGLNATLARMDAATHDEALQLSMLGHLACVSAGNLFWRSSRSIYTPSLSTGCLAGVMRRRLMELSEEPVIETEAFLDVLAEADAVLFTNSRLLARGVFSVDALNSTYPESAGWAEEWRQRFEKDAISAATA